MQNSDFRAKQFMPFDALKGFKEALKVIEKQKQDKKELSDDTIDYLNNKINRINKNDDVTIKYFSDMEYIETSGKIKKIDYINKSINILNSKINFEDIIDIEF